MRPAPLGSHLKGPRPAAAHFRHAPHPLPLPMGEVAERSEDGEGRQRPHPAACKKDRTPSQSPAVTALPKGEPRRLRAARSNETLCANTPGTFKCRGCFSAPLRPLLPLPLGEVAERSEDGEGRQRPHPAACKKDRTPSQSPAVTALPKGEPRRLRAARSNETLCANTPGTFKCRGCFSAPLRPLLPLPLGEVAERSEDGEGRHRPNPAVHEKWSVSESIRSINCFTACGRQLKRDPLRRALTQTGRRRAGSRPRAGP